MSKLTKKQKALQGKVDSNRLYSLSEALVLIKEAATAKFDESIDVAVQLGIDAKKADQETKNPGRQDLFHQAVSPDRGPGHRQGARHGQVR